MIHQFKNIVALLCKNILSLNCSKASYMIFHKNMFLLIKLNSL